MNDTGNEEKSHEKKRKRRKRCQLKEARTNIEGENKRAKKEFD